MSKKENLPHNTQIIALSGKQYSGKDMVADFLLRRLPAFQKTPIAYSIKKQFASENGLTLQAIEAEKSKYRQGLIALGNRQRAIDPDYWITKVLEIPGSKIISDLRLLREYKLLKQHGAYCIRVTASKAVRASRGNVVAETDPTECELDTVTDWDYCIENNSTPETLRQQLNQLFL